MMMISRETDKEITQVRICGRDYNISNDEWQPLYIKKLAEILETEIKNIEEETKIVDNYKLLILAGLSISDRLLKIEEMKTGSNKLAEKEIEKLNIEIEGILS
ncbi:MAG: cell division protein ZapA [Elusimicrobia bacterium]|nr:cell division protein ZapA [Elusimicrobiota bacterium]